jgi:hypothetical protein
MHVYRSYRDEYGLLNEIKRAHSFNPLAQGAWQALSASFLSFHCSKIICLHVHEEVEGGAKPINVASVLVGANTEKNKDRTLSGEHVHHINANPFLY